MRNVDGCKFFGFDWLKLESFKLMCALCCFNKVDLITIQSEEIQFKSLPTLKVIPPYYDV